MDISDKTRDILNFRPRIDFIEPEQQDSPIVPITEEISLVEVSNRVIKIKNLANSVNKLATAVQIKIDNKSKDQIVILDSAVDNAVIRSLRRSYPDAANFDRITYDQYKQCKDNLRNYASRVSLRSAISEDDINHAKGELQQGNFTVGGIGTEAATNGGLRPELDDRNRLIEPLDMEETQSELIKILMNLLWKKFLLKIIKAIIPFPLSLLIPEEIAKVSKSTQQMVEGVSNTLDAQSAASRKTSKQLESGDYPTGGSPEKSTSSVNFPEIANPMQFQDCNIITKTYEKGCHASMTEASVFAPFTSQLDFIRNQSSAISNQMDGYAGIAPNATGLNKNSAEAELKNEDGSVGAFLDKLIPDGLGFKLSGSLDIGLDSECIPCGLRIELSEEFNLKKLLSDFGQYLLGIMEAWLNRALSQILNLIEMFRNMDKYMDICSFINFFKDFVCIPDLAKILAILAALMMDLSIELNFVVDLALSLIVPLFMPFLTYLLDTMMGFVLLILKPIECIIDSIQNMLSKLDYNVLFQNIPPKVNLINPTATVKTKIQIPILGSLIPEPITVLEGESALTPIKFDLAPFRRAKRAEEQAAVDKAYAKLQKLKQTSGGVDASDPAAYDKYKKEEREARQEYSDTLRERDLSEIGEANLAIEKFQTQIKSIILELVGMLRKAVLKFDAWVRSLFDEFKKMLNEYVGGTGTYINFGMEKLAIIQMIALIKSIIEALDHGCDDKNQEVETMLNSMGKEAGFKVFSDDSGNIYIEENIEEIDDIAKALNPNGSLIDYTGDEVLDSSITDAVRKLTIPNQIKINCSLLTSATSREQVNQWISEIKSE